MSPKKPAPSSKSRPGGKPSAAAAKNSDSAPANGARGNASDPAIAQAGQREGLARAMPSNPNKPLEIGRTNAVSPPEGTHFAAQDPRGTASTLSEDQTSEKTGTQAALGENAATGSLDRVRVDSSGQVLTTNQGVPIADNQNSLKAGLRGPTLLEDFILREKITHFDHERIPERIVHARGSGAHGFFEAYEALSDITMAAPFQEAGKITPTFVRFSTVQGERGSKDTARDVRGFAVKFYTDQGNWDLVGNNMPVFFIQDAMKFPDLVHAVKPEPHHGMPQAGSAHDTFWDFVSLMPESTHMLMWAMSDRGIPRSYRMMQGFGVHTFRLINEQGRSTFVKFHWSPKLGTHSLTWDEAVKISGADPDYHRRDLWEAIEAGEFPEWELGLQLFTEEQSDKFAFDILDATKLIPEELMPVRPVGRLVLNRNPDNFFAETEQVAFCTAHIIPGIDFTNDPLLAGRIHSYVDTQLSRLGGPNFHEIPINAPIVPVHNNQRDGLHRQAIPRGAVAYEPNSLGGGCPFQAGSKGFRSFPQPVQEDKLRGKPEKFAEHFDQARLFFESQTPVEQAHIVAAFRFELSKVTVPAIRARTLAMLRNASEELAQQVADGLGTPLPDAQPRAATPKGKTVRESPSLSLMARPGDGSIRTRKVAILIAPGFDFASAQAVHDALIAEGAVPRFVGPRIGPMASESGEAIDCDASFENEPGFLFDAAVVPDGDKAVKTLVKLGQAGEFIVNVYRHCKPLLAIGAGSALLDANGASPTLDSGEPDPGVILVDAGETEGGLDRFVSALAQHRHFEREKDPPTV
jgi:catalase